MNEQEEKQKIEQQVAVLDDLAKQWMSKEAVMRYGALKAAYPERALQVAALIGQLVQQGQLKQKISDAELKSLLMHLQGQKKETKIKRV